MAAIAGIGSIPLLTETLAQKRAAREAIEPKMQESLAAKSEVEAAEKAMEAGRTERLVSDEAAEQERYAARAASAPQREKMAAIRERESQPFIPTQENSASLATLFSLINIAGFALGAGGKKNARAAMAGMNGMLEGYQKGRADLYAKERQQFDMGLKQLKMQYDQLDRELTDAIKTFQTDRDAGMQKARVAFAKAGADFYRNYAEKYGLAKLYEVHKQAYQTAQKAEDTALNELKRAQDRAEAERRHRELLQQRAEQASDKKAKQYGSTSDLVEKFTGAKLKDKEATEVAIAANAIGDAAAIKQIVADNPQWVGRTGQVKNVFNRMIESINMGTPEPDDAGQPELVFAKRYAEYLVNYERALAGGARGFTVYFQRRFNQLLEQNQFNAAGMANLMNEQTRTIMSKAMEKAPSITQDKMRNLALDIKTRAGDTEAIQGLSGGQAAAPAAAEPKTKKTSFATVEEAQAAADRKEIKAGDRITIGGQSGVWE